MSDIPNIPRDASAERQIIEAALSGGESIGTIMEQCTAEDFFMPAERGAFALLKTLFQAGRAIDEVVFTSELFRLVDLNDDKETGGVPPQSLLGVFNGSVIADVSIATHIARAKEARRLRSLHRMALETLSGIGEGADSKKLTSAADTAIMDVSGMAATNTIKTAREVANEALGKIQAAAELKGKLKGVPTGLPALDYFTSGFQEQQLIVIAARPGVGKSVICNQATLAIARAGFPVGKFDLEMSAADNMVRSFASDCTINLRKLMSGSGLTEHDLDSLGATSEEISKLPIFYDDASTLNLAEFRAKAKRMVTKHGVKAIIVDYLQLMDGGEQAANRVEEVTLITRTLKQMARSLKVPVIVLAQLNRKPDGGKAELHHLRESGSIEQDADIVMLLNRKAERTQKQIEEGEFPTVLDIAKQRNGPTPEIELILQGKYARFIEAPIEH